MRVALALSAILLGFALASCGGGDDESNGGLENAEPVALPAGSTPKAEYIRRVNAICALEGSGLNADIAAAVREQFAAGRSGPDAFSRAMGDVLPQIIVWYQRAFAIPPPPGDRDELERYFGYVRRAFQETYDLYDAYERGDTAQAKESAETLDQQESANAFARSYGLRKCTGFTDTEAEAFEGELESKFD